jgi:uncharacterized phage protein (TIGR02220 family)
VDAVNVLLDRFEHKYNIIIYSKNTNEVAIKNFLRHSIVKGGKPVEDCIKKEMSKVKNRKLISEVFGYIDGKDDLNDTVRKIINEFENDNDNDNDNDNENEVSWYDSSTIREIVEYLNLKAGTNYRPTTPKTKDKIIARLKENWKVEDFKIVIDKKCADWLGDEKMEQYLRPETLFGTKFESYLNAKVTNKKPVNTGMNEEEKDMLDDLF